MSVSKKDDPQSSQSGDKNDTGKDDLEVDNSQSVLLKIANLYAEQLMSDLVLEVGGKKYPAHRLILCASSEVFQVMLMNREWSEWRESCIVLQETPSAEAVFPHFLKYFYTGQIRISHESVLPVLCLADKYNVTDLVTLCLSYMSQNIAQAARRGQIISWMQYTMACGHDHVAKACQNFVKWNMEWVWQQGPGGEGEGQGVGVQEGGQVGELDADTLLLLLQQSDLVLHNEMALYMLVVRWLNKQRERLEASDVNEADVKMHLDSLVPEVFSHVRFPMMCPNQLAKLLLCPLTQDYKDFFMDRMAIAMSYQSGQYERVAEVQATECGRMLFTPRLYTEDIWGSILAVDNFHSLPCYHTRTFIFSTRPKLEQTDNDKLLEWSIDLYPKGVWFRKSMLIVWAGTYDVPEVVLRTVRISITCQNPDPAPAPPPFAPAGPAGDRDMSRFQLTDVRVKVGILLWGVQKGVEHVSAVVERVHRFSPHNRVLNIDGALDFDELNTPLYTPADCSSSSTRLNSRCPKCTESCEPPEPKHLLGPNRDQLRIQVVIVPLTNYCHVVPDLLNG